MTFRRMLLSPSIQDVRLATHDDLHRISLVAAAAFFWSPTFQFQRPRYRDFPSDTLASYLVEYQKAVEDPACVVLVAEDVIQHDEVDHIYDALRPAFVACPQAPRGIVGVCSFTLKPNSSYLNHFLPETAQPHTATGPHDTLPALLSRLDLHHRKRDQCVASVSIYEATTRQAKLEYTESLSRVHTGVDNSHVGISLARCA
jgi:hypothetical protein